MSKPEKDYYGCQHEYDQERAERDEEARAHEDGNCGGYSDCEKCREAEDEALKLRLSIGAGPRTLMKRRMDER